ncbi:hypothetical protein [Paenibacillus silvestris]|nr:hypothetical protein [Paenibacillus silvestris]
MDLNKYIKWMRQLVNEPAVFCTLTEGSMAAGLNHVNIIHDEKGF